MRPIYEAVIEAAVDLDEEEGKLKAKEAKLVAQFEAKSKAASELIARADEKEKEASARAETLRAAAEA